MQIIKHSNECRVRMLIHSSVFTRGGQWYKVLKPYYIAYRKNVNKHSIDLTATKRPESTCKWSHGTPINRYIFQYICNIPYIISILSWLNSLTTTFFMKHIVSSTVILAYLHLDSRCLHKTSSLKSLHHNNVYNVLQTSPWETEQCLRHSKLKMMLQ